MALLVTLILIISGLSGCGNQADTGNTDSAQTTNGATAETDSTATGNTDTAKVDEIYFLNFKPEIAEVYDAIAADYEAETGIKVKVVTAASGTYEQTLRSEIAKSDPPTIFQINGPVGYENWKDFV